MQHLPLDPLLMTELRLAIMSILMQVEETDFLHIKEVTGATVGNISIQLDKLSEAGYLTISKSFVGKRPRTSCRITKEGRTAFTKHFEALKSYLPDTTR